MKFEFTIIINKEETMIYTGNIEKDFSTYLITSKLWNQYTDSHYDWIYKIGKLMEIAINRTAKENSNIKEDDILWWVNLVELQNFYGFDRDIFGEFLEVAGLTSQKNGQFFTPMNLCKLVSKLTYTENEPEDIVTISDCASGSGRMMIAHASIAKDSSSFSNNYIYYNQDIDYKAFIFTTLNASLRNLASINVWGDTLAVTVNKVFVTVPSIIGRAPWFAKTGEYLTEKIMLNIS